MIGKIESIKIQKVPEYRTKLQKFIWVFLYFYKDGSSLSTCFYLARQIYKIKK